MVATNQKCLYLIGSPELKSVYKLEIFKICQFPFFPQIFSRFSLT